MKLIFILIIAIVFCLLITSSVLLITHNNKKSIPTIQYNQFVGPVPEGYNETLFRQTGLTKHNKYNETA